MTKSELIEKLMSSYDEVQTRDIEVAVKELLEFMAQTLQRGERIEIRGFGSFSLHYRAPRTGRNPKTGELVDLTGKYVPHFKPGKELRDRVEDASEEVTVGDSIEAKFTGVDRKNRVVTLSVKAKDQAEEKDALDKVNQTNDDQGSTNAMAEAFKAAKGE